MRLRRTAWALLGALALLAGARPAAAQLSPGPLARAHERYDGSTQCFQCHTRGSTTGMDARCLDCHTEIAVLRQSGRGFHARDGKGACATCHPDHAGRDFALVKWDEGAPEKFDHARTGWPLGGKHAALACAKCHTPALQRGPAAVRMRRRDRSRSWLGLATDCASCHADPHRAQLGSDCARCHNDRGWKPAPGFDHARSAYPLTGKHAALACSTCHLAPAFATARDPQGRPLPQWKPLPHADCAPCHKDPHAGRFAKACASCHRTDTFAAIDARGFDHDRTRYPLRGRHAAVACAKCHDERTAWGKKPAFAACGDCHKDAHAGQATLAGRPADCAACHTVEGFEKPAYTLAQHQQGAWPLQGRHASVACAGCHAKQAPGSEARLGAARVPIRMAHAACTDCHHDPHAGRFAAGGARPWADGCRGCHSLDAYRPSTMDVALHAKTTFALAGAHRAVPCLACHAELKAAPARSSLLAAAAQARPLRFAESRAACADCHADPHGGQFARRTRGAACDACHGVERFAPADRFDHARDSAFRLDGAHAKLACAACHKPVRRGAATVVRYLGTPGRCVDCHTNAMPDSSHSSWAPLPGGPAGVPSVTLEASHASHLR